MLLIRSQLIARNFLHSLQPFGRADKPVRIKTMNNSLQPHTPFAELPVQARVLFYIFASTAVVRFGTPPPTPADLAPQLEAVWNRHKLRQEDLRDPDRLTALLEKELASTTDGDPTSPPTRCRRAR